MSDLRTITCVNMAARARRKADEYVTRGNADPAVIALGLMEAVYWTTLGILAASPLDVDAEKAIDQAIAESRT